MSTVRRGPVTVELPDTLTIESRAARRRTLTAAPPEEGLSTEDIASALSDQLAVVDVLPLAPTVEPTGTSGRRRRGSERVSGPQRVPVRVDVAANEHAVILVEQDGVLTWVHGTKEAPRAAVRGRRAAGASVVFELEVRPTGPSGAARTRGFSPGILLRPLRAVVFKFVVGVAVGQVVKRLERSITPGLVLVDTADPTRRWPRYTGTPKLRLPTDRKARILLLVHGTFSSTMGGFGALLHTVPGQRFLSDAIAGYDAVLGFDHRTLSEDPLENAQQLLAALRELDAGQGIEIEAVTHSRGALVLRSLLEHLLTPADPVTVTRAVLVAGPNAGTRLAEPERWKDLVDLYTNLAVAGSRFIAAVVPQTALAATVLAESMKGLSIFVKALTASAVDESNAPGLAAMRPGGAFVVELNKVQPTQPPAQQIAYYAVTSDFEPDGLSGPGKLPLRLGAYLSDGVIDRLMGAANDLVVDVPSMTSVDAPVLAVRDTFSLSANGRVYHTNYFDQYDVISAITLWLSMGPAPAPAVPAPAVPAGATVTGLPAEATEDFVVLDADLPSGLARKLFAKQPVRYAVVRNSALAGTKEHYPFQAADFDRVLAGLGSSESLGRSRTLRAMSPAREVDLGDVAGLEAVAAQPARATPAVVVKAGRPVGIMAPAPKAPTRAAKKAAAKKAPAKKAAAKGAPAKKGAARRAKGPVRTEISAVMPDQVEKGTETTVLVELALEHLEVALGSAAKVGVFDADPAKQVTVHVIPRTNVSVVGESLASVPLPGPGDPRLLQFRLRADHAGPGEIAVIAEQGPVVLVRLVLGFTVTAGPVVASRTVSAGGRVEPAEPVAPCDQLWIEETKVVDRVTVDGGEQYAVVETAFDVRYLSERLDVQERATTKAIKGDRLAYVTALFRRIEDDWGQSQEDAAAFEKALKAYGGQLFDELVPEPIQRVLWDNRDRIKTIQINSEDPLIPWELVHLKSPRGALPAEDLFLANLGLVRWLDGARIAPAQLSLGAGRALVLAPDYPPESQWTLEGPAKEFAFLAKKFHATRVEPTLNGVLDLLDEPGRFDLLHFAGHGLASPDDIGHAGIVLDFRLEDGQWQPVVLESTLVEQFANLRDESGRRPLVFLNACQVGRGGYQLTGTGGFAQAFLRGGAGAFVSSLWAVGDEPALAFGRAFYNALARGRTVAAAATEARRKARAAGDPTWLAYVVYGRPEATLTVS